MTAQQHLDVGAYALGALEQADAERFEAHLAGCDTCAAELARLTPLVGLLADAPPPGEEGEDEPPSGMLDRLLAEAASARTAQRRRRRQLVLAAVVAAVAAIAGPVVTAAVTSDDVPAQEQTVAGDKISGRNPETGVEASIGLRPVAWGTSVDLELRGVSGPLRCDLAAVAADGARETVTSWSVPAQGYGVGNGGGSSSLRTQGGTGMAREDIARFEVTTSAGELLLAVPADPR